MDPAFKFTPSLHWNSAMKNPDEVEDYPMSSMYLQEALCGKSINYSTANTHWWTTDPHSVTCEICKDQIGMWLLANVDFG